MMNGLPVSCLRSAGGSGGIVHRNGLVVKRLLHGMRFFSGFESRVSEIFDEVSCEVVGVNCDSTIAVEAVPDRWPGSEGELAMFDCRESHNTPTGNFLVAQTERCDDL